ncbi:hypothetical protein K3495_g6185 [Podosphaera aphanis]|nr:hypothetical protein K3495_g6185 [Podosphaera aphanis]
MMDMTETPAHQNFPRRESDTNQALTRTIPIVQVPNILNSAPDDFTNVVRQSSSMMVPLAQTNPESETNGAHLQTTNGDQTQTGSLNGPSTSGAASAPQPKVVQTAFIHKLYNMLEDQSIQHLISWSNTAESFVMSPSNDFSKVLSQYFKHTNISSFVRQLNMYGFHKVSDVFHTGSPESPLWEFKHGNGNFKRGDLVGLREIKRRASRHALVHRDSYSVPKPNPSQHGPSIESINSHQASTHDSTESRLTNLEQTSYELHALLQKSEENSTLLQSRNQVIIEALSRSLQTNHDLSRIILSTIPNSNVPIHRDVANVQAEIQRQVEALRSLDEHAESQNTISRPFFSNISPENGSLSPHQISQEDSRRGPAINLPARNSYYHRPPIPSLFSGIPHSINASNSHSSPSSLRSQAPPYPPHSHPLSNSIPYLSPPTNLSRRHTSADIRNVNGWQPNLQSLGPGQTQSVWPSSPRFGPTATNEEQHIRDSFSSYSITAASRLRAEDSRPTTPPSSSNCPPTDHSNNYPWVTGKEKLENSHKDTPAAQYHRGNMAHILNPTETTGRRDCHEETTREDDRKRKRI